MAISPDGRSAWVPSKQDNIKRGIAPRRIAAQLPEHRPGHQLPCRSRRGFRGLPASGSITTIRASRARSHSTGSASTCSLRSRRAARWRSSTHTPASRSAASTSVAHRRASRSRPAATGCTSTISWSARSACSTSTQLQTEGIAGLPLITNAATLASEKLSATVLQGKRLFYDAVDTRLARDAYLSCASCHNDGGQDGRVWDLTGFGEGLRNTANLNGRAGGQGFLHWTQQLRRSPGLRRADPEPCRRQRPHDQRPVQHRHAQRAAGRPESRRERGPRRACRLRRRRSQAFSPSPLRNADGSMTAAASAGRNVFIAKNCSSCHGGTAFTIECRQQSAGHRHDQRGQRQSSRRSADGHRHPDVARRLGDGTLPAPRLGGDDRRRDPGAQRRQPDCRGTCQPGRVRLSDRRHGNDRARRQHSGHWNGPHRSLFQQHGPFRHACARSASKR